jgi:hypothetical protein
MMNIDVATAKCIGKSIKKCMMGTITTPPPMPNKPEKKPPKKLSGKPFFKSEEYSKTVPAESAILRCHNLSVFSGLDSPNLYVISILKATKTRKMPNISPNWAGLMIFAVNAPIMAPGIVAIDSIKPSL